MHDLITRYATAAATTLFAVVAVSGVMMFFHVGKGTVAEMHEWLSIVFVAVAGLHVYRNWNAFLGYFRRGTIAVPAALTIAAGLAFVVPAVMAPHMEPMPRLFQAIESARLSDIARLAGAESDTLMAALKARGFAVQSADERVSEIAAKSARPPRLAINTIVAAFPAQH